MTWAFTRTANIKGIWVSIRLVWVHGYSDVLDRGVYGICTLPGLVRLSLPALAAQG